jgi:hypothetical protein
MLNRASPTVAANLESRDVVVRLSPTLEFHDATRHPSNLQLECKNIHLNLELRFEILEILCCESFQGCPAVCQGVVQIEKNGFEGGHVFSLPNHQ